MGYGRCISKTQKKESSEDESSISVNKSVIRVSILKEIEIYSAVHLNTNSS